MTSGVKRKKLDSTSLLEIKTLGGQLLQVECVSGQEELVKNLFAQLSTIWVEEPSTRRTIVDHGGYSGFTRYNIVQHEYIGGGNASGGGYIELLEIKDPPTGRCGTVIHAYVSHGGHRVFEFKSLISAKRAFNPVFDHVMYGWPEPGGVVREFVSGWLEPWFCAVGDQNLLGDFVFPDVFAEEDDFFRVGRKFVVSENGAESIKICMGCLLEKPELFHSYPGEAERKHRIVQWLDGTQWRESYHTSNEIPKPLEDVSPSLAANLKISFGTFGELMPDQKSFILSLPTGEELVGVIQNKPSIKK